jgi:hypothetical protein
MAQWGDELDGVVGPLVAEYEEVDAPALDEVSSA